VIAAEPVPSTPPSAGEVDALLSALADFADLKSPYHVGHSSSVAALAGSAARVFGLPENDVTLVRRAGWVHDIGRIAVSSAVWASPTLRPHEHEQVRMHPYHTTQVLSRTSFLRSLDEVASAHHERLDGTGYYRGLPAAALSAPARILAAADTFHAKIEPRPHRAALSPAESSAYLRSEAGAGRLDTTAVEAVLTAAGEQASSGRSGPRLTPREVEILVHVSRGGSMREIARALSIAPKTVDGHLQRIYPKIGVSTRAGATLYAMQHGLLSPLVGAEPQKGENSP
jgi:HD-GYP domain-containing protein (c-di-GMP phosphodiesterase class II)